MRRDQGGRGYINEMIMRLSMQLRNPLDETKLTLEGVHGLEKTWPDMTTISKD